MAVAILLGTPQGRAAAAPGTPAGADVLSPATRSSLKRLEKMQVLEGATWEWHLGNLPHGEDPSSNDGGWKLLDEKAGAGKGSFWLRGTIHVPRQQGGYELADAGLLLSLSVSPSGTTPEILYLNGRRIAMGADLEPEVLESKLHPGETISVALKLLSTEGDKSVRTPTLMLRFAPDRPDPTRLQEECESAAWLLPTVDADQNMLSADLQRIEAAIAAVDFASLDHGQQAVFDASLRKAEAMLEPLRPKLAALTVDAVGNSHLDAAWRWPWTETLEATKNTWTSAVQMLGEYPNFKYAVADMQYDEWVQTKYPGLFRDLQALSKSGQLDVVGGMWAEPDLNEPDGETMVRELLVGQRYMKASFGKEAKIGWNVDSFGYSWQLPQVYKKSGVDFFVTQKENWNEDNKLPLKLFWWQSPDGSAVLTYFPMSYYGTTDPVQMAQELAKARPLAPGLNTIMHLFGVGDHGGGPTRVQLDKAETWSGSPHVYPTLKLSTPTEFFNTVAPKVTTLSASPVWSYKTLAAGQTRLPAPKSDRISVPVWRDELYLETHRGTYTTQAKQKKNMRDSEEWLLDAEKFSALTWALGGVPYPKEPLNVAWKNVLFNTNHDLAAGSGIGQIYKDAQVDYDAVHATTNSALQNSMDWLTERADTRVEDPAKSVPVVVFNSLGWTRDGLVTVDVQLPDVHNGISVLDAEKKPVPTQVLSSDSSTGSYKLLIKPSDVPAVGFKVLQVTPAQQTFPTDLRVYGTTLENALLRIVLDPKTGCIVHLISKDSGFDSIADGGCGDQLQMFVDKPKKYDAWNIDKSALTQMTPIETVDSIEVVDKGPLRASIRVRRHWGSSTFEQTTVLYAGTGRVDVENKINWHETHTLLKAAVPLRASSDVATYEIPYGVIERPTTRDNSIDAAKYEVPALRWADLGDSAHGLSLINNSKYGYDATPHLLRLSLLRSPIYPDPDADRGLQTCVFSLFPHAGTWRDAMTERLGYEFNYALTAHQASAHGGSLGTSHSLASFDDKSAILTALKKSEDGNALILRAYEWSGKTSEATVQVPPGVTNAFEADMMERATSSTLAVSNGTLRVTMHPYEIKTIRIEYPKR